ncbi:hypothetical protein niasHT_038941 [Heterodera trifolii]|uniref:EGF-like domain-containing protein n=1 Tax=Heterodera trifolii TaxID=157864 RepID=A0ABD2HTN3_9BILA
MEATKSGKAFAVVPVNECADETLNDCDQKVIRPTKKTNKSNGSDLGTVALTMTLALMINECLNPLMNDCSPEAECVDELIGFSCHCKQGRSDISPRAKSDRDGSVQRIQHNSGQTRTLVPPPSIASSAATRPTAIRPRPNVYQSLRANRRPLFAGAVPDSCLCRPPTTVHSHSDADDRPTKASFISHDCFLDNIRF